MKNTRTPEPHQEYGKPSGYSKPHTQPKNNSMSMSYEYYDEEDSDADHMINQEDLKKMQKNAPIF